MTNSCVVFTEVLLRQPFHNLQSNFYRVVYVYVYALAVATFDRLS